MRVKPGMTLAAIAAAALVAGGYGAAYAAKPKAAGAPLQAQPQESPKDCKMKPEDPRCKDDKKG